MSKEKKEKLETVAFAGGCFWCTEAVFSRLKGVVDVTPGYTGGHTPDPDYEQVCTGTTGHAEAVLVRFRPGEIRFVELLEVFFDTHDPTTPDRQGNDVGTQYRSAVFFTMPEQEQETVFYIKGLTELGIFENPVVTEIAPLGTFYPAEDYHRDYFRNHPDQAYCRMVIRPKVNKFTRIHAAKIKTG